MRRFTVLLIVGSLLALSLTGLSTPATARGPDFERRPFTVIAVVDSGINPYHVDFRRPELTVHPSKYIEGFPKDAKALDLTLDADSYEEAVEADKQEWSRAGKGDFVWIPGTNIIGAMTLTDESIRDEVGHGTPVASLAAGRVHGPASNDLVIVALEGFSDAVDWAAEQPWIDVITNSWSSFGPSPQEHAEPSRKAVAAGKIVCYASGNFAAPVWMSGSQGGSWNVNVGAASHRTRGEHAYTSYPNDVLGPSQVPAATLDSIDGEADFGGTSAATPNVCGEIANTITDVRAALGDYDAGPAQGLARGRRGEGPYLKDGCIDREELEEVIQATARPAESSPPDPADPYAIPAPPAAGFLRGGYGIVDEASAKDAMDVLFGRAPKPERELEDQWTDQMDGLREAVYGAAPGPTGC
ncbi:MAG TPA: S8 family serine peptidase [Actinomycetota bacterium]|nr:S8 family serine peptidase [Actinomycetota bacterium]